MHRRRRSWRDSVFAAVVIGVLSGKAVAASWSYQDITDEMSGEKGKQASVTSTNKLSFKFPYQGAQRAKLVIRDHPVHGKDAIVMIDRGQMLCGINECELRVRFDDGEVIDFRAVPPADHDSRLLFITYFDRFIKNTLASKKVRIEVQFYQEGARVLEFDIEGLSWP